jgi:hypothetical protein
VEEEQNGEWWAFSRISKKKKKKKKTATDTLAPCSWPYLSPWNRLAMHKSDSFSSRAAQRKELNFAFWTEIIAPTVLLSSKSTEAEDNSEYFSKARS